MRFSIITPSFRSSEWLKLCVASVADQEISLEHIVQDSCSDDGTGEWLPLDSRVRAFIEKDRGMYDAVNRGYQRAQGELLGHLNCDEQYLPGALRAVSTFFDSHPEIDVVFADTVVVDAEGRYLCDRRALVPHKYHTLVGTTLSFLTCSTFLRRRVIHELGLGFDPDLKDLGDCDWALKLIGRKVPMATLRVVTTAFTNTGANMSAQANARRERQALFESAPWWARQLRQIIIAQHRLRRLASGAYAPAPYEYAIRTRGGPAQRQVFQVTRPTFRWVRPAA